MNTKIALAVVAGLMVGALAATTLATPAHGITPTTSFKECAFIPAFWHPDHAPKGVPKHYKSITPVPEGWTVVGGTMTSAPAMFVCR